MKENPLENKYKEMEKLPLEEKKKAFIDFCLELIKLKEKGEITEEQVGVWITSCLSIKELSSLPEFEEIFDIAPTLELPREISYRQKIGEWDKKTADRIKEEEWKELVVAVRAADHLI